MIFTNMASRSHKPLILTIKKISTSYLGFLYHMSKMCFAVFIRYLSKQHFIDGEFTTINFSDVLFSLSMYLD